MLHKRHYKLVCYVAVAEINKNCSDPHSLTKHLTSKREYIEGGVRHLQVGNNAALHATLVPLQPLRLHVSR